MKTSGHPKCRKALRVCAAIAALAAAIVVVLPWFLGPVVKGAVQTVGPRILGVPVTVERISVSALRGTLEIRGFEIGNPEGFDTPYLLHSDKLFVELSGRELLRGTCHIHDIQVLGPRVWYHRKLASSNLSTLLDNLGGDKEKPKAEKKDDAGKKDGSTPVVIDHFIFDEGTVGVKIGAGVEVPLAKVELFDIGKDGAFMPVQIVRIVLGAVFDSVIHAVGAIGGAAADAVGAAGGAALNAGGAAVKAVGGAAGAVVKGVGSIFGGGGGDKSE